MKQHLNEIGIMRAFLILSIVLGHTFAIYSGFSASWIRPEAIRDVTAYHWLNWIFIAFSLQSFVFISGYLMAYSESLTKIKPKVFIKKKFVRLILPLLFFGICYSLWIDGKSSKELIDWGGVIYVLSGPGHLWFLPTLFLCFIGAIIIIKNCKWRILPTIILCIASLFVPDVLRLSQFCFYLIFFMTGYLIYFHREKVLNMRNTYLTIFWWVLAIFVALKIFFKSHIIPHQTIFLWVNNIVLGILGSVLLLNLCHKLTKYKCIVLIGTWNGFFGVYLFHQFILRYLIYKTEFLYSMNSYVYPIVIFVVTIITSVLLSCLFLKNQILRKLI